MHSTTFIHRSFSLSKLSLQNRQLFFLRNGTQYVDVMPSEDGYYHLALCDLMPTANSGDGDSSRQLTKSTTFLTNGTWDVVDILAIKDDKEV